MSDKKKKCQICGGYIFEDDDKVVCPICGAPYHRDCYASLGKCALGDKHGTSEQYDLTHPKEQSEGKVDNENRETDGVVCPHCHCVCDRGAQVCPHCNRPLTGEFTPPFGGNGQNTFSGGVPPFGANVYIDPYGGISPKATLEDGVTAEDVKNYTAVNTPRYVGKFFTLKKEHKSSWNWAAFLFPHAWLFSRKMYFKAFAVTVIMIAAAMCSFPVQSVLAQQLPQNATQNDLVNFVMNNSSEFIVPLIMQAVGFLTALGIRIVSALMGDWWYRNHAITKIKEIKSSPLTEAETANDIDITKKLTIKGGVNLYAALLSLIVIYFAPAFIFSLII